MIVACEGQDASCIHHTWDQIYQNLLPAIPYELCQDFDLEYYPSHHNIFCELWLPVEKKEIEK